MKLNPSLHLVYRENLFKDSKLEEQTQQSDAQKELEVSNLIEKRLKEAKQYVEKYSEGTDGWKECEDFYEGYQWKDKKRSYKNLIFPLVEQEVASLTDAISGVDVLSHKEEHQDRAKMLEAALHFVFDRNKIHLKESMAIRESLKTGNGYLYVDFDPEADEGKGMPIVKNINWRHVFIDPAASEIDEAQYVIIRFPSRLDELKRKFPQHAERIAKEAANKEAGSSSWFAVKENKSNFEGQRATPEDKYNLEGMSMLDECWMRDFTMEEIPEEETLAEIQKEAEQFFNGEIPDIGRHEDHMAHVEAHKAQMYSIAAQALAIEPGMVTDADLEGLKEDPQFGLILGLIEDHIKIHENYEQLHGSKRPRYMGNLRLVMRVGQVIVYDGPAPVEDGRVPLVPYYCYKNEGSIYATGEIKNILPIQKSFNEMDNAEYVGLHLNNNPGWISEKGNGINPSSITNKPGQVFQPNPGTAFRRLEPGQVSPQLEQRKVGDQTFMQIITGINEASQGRSAGGVTAARAIERLQQQTNGRFRLKSSYNTLYSKQRLGELVATRIVKYWTTERYLRIQDSATAEMLRSVYEPEMVHDLEYEVRAVPGPLAGIDKEAIYDVMATFVDKGMITPKTFFQVVDVPYKKKILEDLEANDQLMQQAQALAMENEQLKLQLGGAIPSGQVSQNQPNVAPETVGVMNA